MSRRCSRRPSTRLPPSAFSGFRFPPHVILLAVRWYLRFGLSYRDVEELLAERGVDVDHVTVYRWVQRFTPMLAEAARVAAAVAHARRVIVVGRPPTGLARVTAVVCEDPPGSGPVAALAAGITHVAAPHVAVLAADLPFVTAEAVTALPTVLAAAAAAAVALPVDDAGRDQRLCVVWRAGWLRAAFPAVGDPTGVPVRRLLDVAGPLLRSADLGRDGEPPPWFDCDTPADLAEAERWA